MRYFDYLRKRIFVYLIWGIFAGVVISLNLLIYRYNIHLSEIISQITSINTNAIKIKQEIQEIDAVKRFMNEEFGIDISRYDSDSYLLIMLDAMKRDFQNAVFTVSSPQYSGDLEVLALNISTTVHNNRSILDYVIYLDSLRLPDFRFDEIRLTKENQGILMNIKGSLILPISQDQGASHG